jgi:ribosome maturation factor RimP
MNEIQEKIISLLQPMLSEIEAEIVEINLHYNGPTLVVSLLVDKMSGGITLDECSRINLYLRQGMERESIVPENDFEIDVASPGLDRPLKTRRDFERALGHEVRFYLAEQVEKKKEHVGTVDSVNEDQVIIITKAGKIAIPFGIINKAVYSL